MKFKNHASEIAIYKTLGIFSTLFFIQGIGAVFVCFVILLNGLASESGDFSGGEVLQMIIYATIATVLIVFGVSLKNIQSEMVDR